MVKSHFILRVSSEVFTKSDGSKRFFMHVLSKNIKDALKRAGTDFSLKKGRLEIALLVDKEVGLNILPRIFGISKIYLVKSIFSWKSKEDVIKLAETCFRKDVEGKTFAVRVKRKGKKQYIPFSSIELEKDIGAVLSPYSRGVDLNEPEITVYIEITEDKVLFFDSTIQAPGGLPVGSEGKALSLVSGGFDSLVASWMLLNRGVKLDFLFFRIAGEPQMNQLVSVLELFRYQWIFGYTPKLFVVPAEDAINTIKKYTPSILWQILLKRLIYKVSSLLCMKENYPYFSTGESIGQVSTQTLANLRVLDNSTDVPVLRPLIGFNKEEIIAKSREIGMYVACSKVKEYCYLLSGKARTSAKEEELLKWEKKIGIAKIVDSLLERIFLQKIAITFNEDSLYLSCSDLTPAMNLVDLRDDKSKELLKIENVIHVDFDKAIARPSIFSRDKVWVFFCEIGIKSSYLASILRMLGVEAYCLKDWKNLILKNDSLLKYTLLPFSE